VSIGFVKAALTYVSRPLCFACVLLFLFFETYTLIFQTAERRPIKNIAHVSFVPGCVFQFTFCSGWLEESAMVGSFDLFGHCKCPYWSKAPSTPATCQSNMSNVAVRHVAVFGNMSNDYFILSTCRNKLNMFNFFRHVERTSNKLLLKKLVWTALSTCRAFINIHTMSVRVSYLFTAVVT